MTRSDDTIVLAVDGGGTRCRLAACNGDSVHRIEVGAANVSTDFDAACGELLRGLDELAAASGHSLTDLSRAPAYLGLAGITGDAIASKLAASLPFDHVRIEDDRAASLRGALGARDGFVAHCGTGSFLAAQQSGCRSFVGGWGPVLGDQASAQWVGRRALSDTLDSVDAVTGPSDMAANLLAQFGGAADIVRAAASMTPTDFGAIAPVVTQHAEQGDALAATIMRDGAGYLADRMTRMGWVQGLPVCLTGGIGPHYAPYLPADMQADLAEPAGDPLTGAIALARAFQKEIENEHC